MIDGIGEGLRPTCLNRMAENLATQKKMSTEFREAYHTSFFYLHVKVNLNSTFISHYFVF